MYVVGCSSFLWFLSIEPPLTLSALVITVIVTALKEGIARQGA
jgi:hypothetical protein